MNGITAATLGIASGVVNTIGLVPYLIDILKRKTKPERAAWWIWLALSVIAFTAQFAAGARWSLFMTGAQTLAVAIVAFLSLGYGYGKFKKKDTISLIIAAMGVIPWRFTHQPVAALLIVIAVDIVGLQLTITKAWEAPHTETLVAWVLATVSGVLGILAVGELSFAKMLYPIYIAIANGMIAAVILLRRRSAQ